MNAQTLAASKPPVVIVTGASRGIGAAAALELAAGPYTVVAVARDEQALLSLQARSPRIIPLRLDVAGLQSAADAAPHIQRIEADIGPIEALVNNAGYGIRGAIEESPLPEVRKLFEVNLFGLLALTQAVLPAMRQRRRGTIVNVSSVVGRVAIPFSGIYSASKFALEGLSDALRRELQAFNIRVALIEPGPVATEFSKTAREASSEVLGRVDSPYYGAHQTYLAFMKHVNSGAVSSEACGRLIARVVAQRAPWARYPIHWLARFFAPLAACWLPTWLVDRLLGRKYKRAIQATSKTHSP